MQSLVRADKVSDYHGLTRCILSNIMNLLNANKQVIHIPCTRQLKKAVQGGHHWGQKRSEIHLEVRVAGELVEDIAKGALCRGGHVDVVGGKGQVVNHSQHLAQDDAVLRTHTPRMHRLRSKSRAIFGGSSERNWTYAP